MVAGSGSAHAEPDPGDRAPAGPPSEVSVRLDEPEAQLERDGSHGFVTVCESPCVLRVPSGTGYRVVRGRIASSTFALTTDSHIVPSFKSDAREYAGGWMTIGGGGLVLISLLFLGLGAASKPSEQSSWFTIGGVTGGVGLGIGVPGLLLFVLNDTTVAVNGVKVAKGVQLAPAGLVF